MKKLLSIILITTLLFSPIAQALKIEEYSIFGQYEVGDVVSNEGKNYICTENNKTNQCNFGEDYEPGVGEYWKRTWELYSDSDETDEEDEDDVSDEEDATYDATKQPGKPSISNLSKTISTSSFILDWSIGKTENPGKILKVYENNSLIKTITAASGEVFKSGKVDITGKKNGAYTYYLSLCNKSLTEKCTKGNSITMTVTGVSGTTIIKDDKKDEEEDSTDDTITNTTIDRTKVPTFAELPKNKTFEDFGKTLSSKIRSDIKSNKMNRDDVEDYLSATQKWIKALMNLNYQGKLTGKEKRSLIILRMVEKTLQDIL